MFWNIWLHECSAFVVMVHCVGIKQHTCDLLFIVYILFFRRNQDWNVIFNITCFLLHYFTLNVSIPAALFWLQYSCMYWVNVVTKELHSLFHKWEQTAKRKVNIFKNLNLWNKKHDLYVHKYSNFIYMKNKTYFIFHNTNLHNFSLQKI
jgi:predicted membrane protein